MPLGDGMLIAAAALVAFALLGRDAWHGIDAHALMSRYHKGGAAAAHHYHTFYLPLLGLAHALVAPLGGGVHRAALLLSAVGAAAGVWLAHVASRRLGLDRGSAAFAALLVATTPAVCYFAVLVEVHAVALPFAGVAWLAMAHWARRPGAGTAALAGGALVLAFLAHPTAVVLGASMLPLWWLARPRPPAGWRQLLGGTAVALAVLLAGVLLLPPLLRAGGAGPDSDFAFAYLQERSARLPSLAHLGITVLREWALPFAPVSAVLLLLAVRGVRGARGAAALALLAAAPFVLVSWLMQLDHEYERGAYATALTWPMAAVAARWCRAPWLRAAALCVAVATAVLLARGLSERPHTVATAAAVQAATGGGPMLWLIGEGADAEAWLTRFPDCDVVLLADLVIEPPAALERSLAHLDVVLAGRAEQREPVVVTSNAVGLLAALAESHAGARTVHEWLQARRGAELARVGAAACHAVRPPARGR